MPRATHYGEMPPTRSYSMGLDYVCYDRVGTFTAQRCGNHRGTESTRGYFVCSVALWLGLRSGEGAP